MQIIFKVQLNKVQQSLQNQQVQAFIPCSLIS
jgi:hypothetical protein